MDELIKPYSICPKCNVGRLSPEASHRAKDAHLMFPGKAMLHCYNFALRTIGCGYAVEASSPTRVAALASADSISMRRHAADAKAAAAVSKAKADADVATAKELAAQEAEQRAIALEGHAQASADERTAAYGESDAAKAAAAAEALRAGTTTSGYQYPAPEAPYVAPSYVAEPAPFVAPPADDVTKGL